MKKLNLFTASLFLASLAVCSFMYVSNNNQVENWLFDANLLALASDETSECYSGGIGASQCSIDGGIDLFGGGVSMACSVTCNDGYYACCGLGCKCIEK